MRRRHVLVLVVFVCAALVGAFFALLLRSSGDSAALRIRGGHVSLVGASKRRTLPHLAGTALTPPPARLSLDAFGGKPGLIDVWASWCIPCREEAPMLARLWRQHRGELRFLGVDVEDTRADARAFVRRYGLNYPNIFDAKAALAGKLGFFGLPTAYLIDRRGRIAAKLVGRQKEATLRAGLEALAREAAAKG